MKDRLSELGLTAITIYRPKPNVCVAFIKRPGKITRAYHHVSSATVERMRCLYEQKSQALMPVHAQTYSLFYWRSNVPLPPETKQKTIIPLPHSQQT